MHKDQLQTYRRQLQRLHEETARTLDDLEFELNQSLRESAVEFSAYDNHPADIATETYEREKDIALREDQRIRLAEVDAALRRIDTGEFGRCTKCGREIPAERLQAMPFAARCLHCQAEEEDVARPRPIEESLVNDLIRGGFTDRDPHENVGFDAEDAWQAVARFGTSNTPGDFRQVESYDDAYIDSDERIGVLFDVDELPDPEAGREVHGGIRPRQG